MSVPAVRMVPASSHWSIGVDPGGSLGPPGGQHLAGRVPQQSVLDGDAHPQPDRPCLLGRVGQEGVLDDQGRRGQAAQLVGDPLVDVQDDPYRPVADRMGANPPAPPDRGHTHLEHDLGIPVEVPAVGRVVGVRLVGGAALHPAVQHQLEPPHPQPVVAEAAVHAQPLDQGDGGVGAGVVGDPDHWPGAHAERPGLPGGLVDAELLHADQRFPDGPHAQRGVGARRLPQPFHQRLRRERWDVRQHPVDGRTFQHAVELAVVAVADGAAGGVGGGRGDASRLQRRGVGDRQVAIAAGQHRMVRAGSVQLESGRQAPLGQVRLVPGDRGLHPLPRGGRTSDRSGEVSNAAGLADRDQRRVLGRLQQVLVGVAERRQQGQVRAIHHPGRRSDQAVQAVGVR